LYLVEPPNAMRHEVMQDDALPLAAHHFEAGFHSTSSAQFVGLISSLSHVTIQNVSMYFKCKYNKNMKPTGNSLHLILKRERKVWRGLSKRASTLGQLR
jgi:hypothetical protein